MCNSFSMNTLASEQPWGRRQLALDTPREMAQVKRGSRMTRRVVVLEFSGE